MRKHLARSLGSWSCALGLALAVVVGTAQPADAARSGWADFRFEGQSRSYSGTMSQRAAGFPRAEFTSDSVGGGVGIQSGASTYLAASTPPGQKYGSSANRPYLNLRPYVQNGDPPSTTTYTFDRPTPASGWTFVLGDVDADAVTITATDADEEPVPVADLGFRSTFNYCVSSVCTRNADLPRWNASTGVLTGNARALDTNGASAWFEPRVPLRSLTFTFDQRAGFPVYQTWFSALEYDLRGVVTVPTGSDRGGITLVLYDGDGVEVARTTTRADGSYAFPGFATYDDYRVTLQRPEGLTSDDPLSRSVDLSDGNAEEDFVLREVVPRPAGGRVTTGEDDDPVANVVITLRDASGQILATTTTDEDGTYLFDEVPVGTGYTVTPTPPPGYRGPAPARRTFDVTSPTGATIDGLDFTLTREPEGVASGRVVYDGSDDGAPGVLITLRGPGGVEIDVRTDADGNWSADGLAPGDHVATVTPLPNTSVAGTPTESFTVPAEGGSVTDVDFALDRLAAPPEYAVGGRVTDERGRPVPGVTVVVTPPGGGFPFTATTGPRGYYRIAGLPAGTYTVTPRAPGGYRVDPVSTEIDLEDDRTAADFTLVSLRLPSPTPEPTRAAESGDEGDSNDVGLADTGGPPILVGLTGLVLLVAGSQLAAGGRHRRSRT